jgi:regulator of sigma E protease
MSGLQTFLTSALTYLVAIGILVAVHEYGHFWAARRVGIKVLRYSLGFGRVLWRRMGRDGTEYALSAIPLGGYVRLLDERDGSVIDPRDLPHAFNRQPVWKRIFVLFAGPGANFLFAIVAYWILLVAGVPGLKPVVGEVAPSTVAAIAGLRSGDEIIAVSGRETPTREAVLNGLIQDLLDDGMVELRVQREGTSPRDVQLNLANRSRELTEPDALFKGLGFSFWYPSQPALIANVRADGPAARAGLLAGDEIVEFDGESVTSFLQLRRLIEPRVNRDVSVNAKRNGEIIALQMRVGEQTRDGKSVGMVGIEAAMPSIPDSMLTIEREGPIAAISGATVKTWDTTILSFKLVGRLITGDVSLKSISGPIGIATVTGVAAQQGILVFISLLALISISVGVLNLLPVPVLDGGQIVYQLVELVKGGPVSERAQVVFQQVGIVLLILLTGLAFYNDIAQLS